MSDARAWLLSALQQHTVMLKLRVEVILVRELTQLQLISHTRS
jgi:hypothetical protein